MFIHLIQGKEGCIFGKENKARIVIVDALRASATATMLLHHGAKRIYVTDEVHNAFLLKERYPECLLFGERNGLPPEGFDLGNSPRETIHAKGKEVIFTTTTGARLLIEGYYESIPFLIMSTTINAKAVSNFLSEQNKDVVIVPAGLFNDPDFSAQEDWVASTYITNLLNAKVGYGKEQYEYWKKRIVNEGIKKLFETAPHSDKLRNVGLQEDILWCAQTNITDCIPIAVNKESNNCVVLEKV